mmetsp:Transcript_50263/g.84100  ORF Transcript_50263/g.84100 Transcript_50263/m.84100 type:complete len:127 (+) Transcript_50263:390-770(+)
MCLNKKPPAPTSIVGSTYRAHQRHALISSIPIPTAGAAAAELRSVHGSSSEPTQHNAMRQRTTALRHATPTQQSSRTQPTATSAAVYLKPTRTLRVQMLPLKNGIDGKRTRSRLLHPGSRCQSGGR